MGTVYFTADLKTYDPATGSITMSFEAADSATAENLLAKLGTEDKVKQVLAGTILSKIKPQLEAAAIPVVAPMTPAPVVDDVAPVATTTPDQQDDWNDNPVNAPDDKAYRLEILNQINKFEGENWNKIRRVG